jgi:hypothetical protein
VTGAVTQYFSETSGEAVALYHDAPRFVLRSSGPRWWPCHRERSGPSAYQAWSFGFETNAVWSPARTGRLEWICSWVENLPALIQALRGRGACFRNEIFSGPVVSGSCAEDPWGHVIELFQVR